MKCPVCNRENGPEVTFCEGCGRKIPRCPTCGVELTSRDRFCANDGTRLSDDLLILVPEETVLQAPVWTQPAPAVPEAPAEEMTMKAAPEEVPPLPVMPDPWSEAASEETVRVTAVSGGRNMQSTPTPVDPFLEQPAPAPKPVQRAFCENCGKRVAPGNRFCSECSRTLSGQRTRSGGKRKKKEKTILLLILILLLIAGLAAGGYALINSDLFDWDSNSSNRVEKEDEDDEEEEQTDDADPTGTEEPVVPGDIVEDPVTTVPSVEDTTPTAPATEPTEPSETEEVTPLMYWIENCDKRYLTEEDLAGFSKQDCVYARNACYAKSGRMFNSTELQAYFAKFDWYHPTVSPNNFNDSMLNAYQIANINLILAYERDHGYN